MRDLPSGTVTFLFTDIEGSTRLIEKLGEKGYVEALADHRKKLRHAFAAHAGVEVDTQGDAFLYAFSDAKRAVAAAFDGQTALASGPVKVRMGLHTGRPHLTGEGYAGRELHRAARIAASGHGGQVVLSAATRALFEGEVSELGEHRLKDFAEPIALFQLGSERFPPLKTISNTNLPRPASSFIGRERERQEVTALLENGARLVTLSGPGGSGKTRLAIEAASGLVDAFQAGVFWVALATIRDPALVAETIADTLGAQNDLQEHIGEREILLLIDNLEQVIEAAPELASLVEACPNLRVLCTSRERLRVRGEVEYAVPPLSEPEAVSLFCNRSRLPGDDAIVTLCLRLDCLPLALELAAARTTVLSPTQILERLAKRLDLLRGGRDAEARQQTLRAAIEWSYDLLDGEEQRLLARLAVFRGGCSLEAAEEVADADLDTLQSLVDKSLLRHSEERFWMLETIREYGLERLEASGDAEDVRRRHADHFLQLGEEAEPHVLQVDPVWLDRLDRDVDNLRAALDWLVAAGETQLVLRFAGALMDFWGAKGYIAEGRRHLEAGLAADDAPTAARAKALNGASSLAIGGADVTTSRAHAREALDLHRQHGNAWGVAASLYLLANAAADDQDFEAARNLWEESLQLWRGVGDHFFTLLAMRMLAWAYKELGEADRARSLMEDVLEQARAAGYRHLQVHALESFAHDAAPDGRSREAASLLKEAYELNRELGDHSRNAIIVYRFARVLAYAGKDDTAARLLAAGNALHEEMGAMPMAWLQRGNDQALALISGRLDEDRLASASDEGRKLSADAAIALALDDLGIED